MSGGLGKIAKNGFLIPSQRSASIISLQHQCAFSSNDDVQYLCCFLPSLHKVLARSFVLGAFSHELEWTLEWAPRYPVGVHWGAEVVGVDTLEIFL